MNTWLFMAVFFLQRTVCSYFRLFDFLYYIFHTSIAPQQRAICDISNRFQPLQRPRAAGLLSKQYFYSKLFLFKSVILQHVCSELSEQAYSSPFSSCGVIWDTCWPDLLMPFWRFYLKAHYVITFNSLCSLCPWRIWFHLTVQAIPFLKVMHGHVGEQQWKWEKCSSEPSLICICQLSFLQWLKGPLSSFLQEWKVFSAKASDIAVSW